MKLLMKFLRTKASSNISLPMGSECGRWNSGGERSECGCVNSCGHKIQLLTIFLDNEKLLLIEIFFIVLG